MGYTKFLDRIRVEPINYFDHPHHLIFERNASNREIDCPVCGKKLGSSVGYNCRECPYGVHESCAKLPQEVKSPFHPQHPITLKRPPYGRQFVCMGCNLQFNGFGYCCYYCDFQLDRECARLVTEEIQPLTHPHHKYQLKLFEMVPNKRYNCALCLKYCSDPLPTFGCLHCHLFLHGSCFDERKFPPEIQHYYHPHPLTFSITSHRTLTPSPQTATTHPELTLPTTSSPPTFTCKACHKSAREIHWCYSCKQCPDFGMDIACTTIKSETESQIQHFLHGHPLSLRYKDVNDQQVASCPVCMKSCTGPTYVCGRPSSDYCENIHFHKSCLEFQQQICHPFHPYHLLTLLDQSNSYKRCNACRNSPDPNSQLFNYICESHNCSFLLHTECSTVMLPAITYQGHDHLLRFRDNNVENIKLMCSACKSNICESYAFTCLYCDLNLHLTCGPLPHIIKHKDHNTHPLFLANSPVQEEAEDETDEFYCHACEEERDPQLPVYYCAKCYFVVEIKCVFSQIISSLKGEYGDVELRSTLGHFGKLICKNKAKEMVQKKEQVKTTLTLFLPFMTVENVPKIDSEWAPKEEVANVGDYMIIRRLAPILEHLLSKHGDISAMSMLRPKAYLVLHVEKEEDDAIDKINRDILALQEKLKCIIEAKSARSSLTEKRLREASILKNWKAGTLFLYNKRIHASTMKTSQLGLDLRRPSWATPHHQEEGEGWKKKKKEMYMQIHNI
ncbi:hypothetical protein SO802_023726 [Lithocarpus litseifolius]|uniref:Phorbol-ester/DAG-type domain-containing protein n=1 Tax=Lithocarpus litseifolius TaxID=425828 RepID=A0AAW2C975_9ROSI